MAALDEARDVATTELGPLPLWGWAVALVSGVLAARALNRGLGTGGSSVGSGGTTTAVASDATGPAGGYTGGLGAPSPSTVSVTPGPVEITNNDDWRRVALADAIASGSTGLAADRALARYLQGGDLNAGDSAIVERALQTIGLPPLPPFVSSPSIDTAPATPSPVAPTPPVRASYPSAPIFAPPATPAAVAPLPQITRTPAPAPAPAATPAAAPALPGGARAIVTVAPGDSLSKIGGRYGVSWRTVFNLTQAHRNEISNPIGTNPNLIHPGESVLIP